MAFANIGSEEDLFAGSSNTTDTASVTVPSLGTNRVGIVVVNHTPGNVAVTGVTWDGVAMTASPDQAANTTQRTYIYYIFGMAHGGTYNIAVTYASSVVHSNAVTTIWADATGTISRDDTEAGTGTTQNTSLSVTTTGASSLMISGSSSTSNGITAPMTGATTLQDYDQGGNCSQVGYSTASSTGVQTHTHNYTDAASGYAMNMISFIEAAAGGYTLDVDSMSIAVTGTDVGLQFNRRLDVDSQSFLINLTDVALQYSRLLNVDSQNWVVTFSDISLDYTPIGGPTYELDVESGSVVITPTDVALQLNRVLSVDSQSFTVSMTAVDFLYNRQLPVDSMSVVTSFSPITLTYSGAVGGPVLRLRMTMGVGV